MTGVACLEPAGGSINMLPKVSLPVSLSCCSLLSLWSHQSRHGPSQAPFPHAGFPQLLQPPRGAGCPSRCHLGLSGTVSHTLTPWESLGSLAENAKSYTPPMEGPGQTSRFHICTVSPGVRMGASAPPCSDWQRLALRVSSRSDQC